MNCKVDLVGAPSANFEDYCSRSTLIPVEHLQIERLGVVHCYDRVHILYAFKNARNDNYAFKNARNDNYAFKNARNDNYASRMLGMITMRSRMLGMITNHARHDIMTSLL